MNNISVHPTNSDAAQLAPLEYSHQIESNFKVLYIGSKNKKISVDNYQPLKQRDIEEYITNTQKFNHPNILYLLRKNLPKPSSNDLIFKLDTTITYPIVLERSETATFMNRFLDTVLANPLIIENVSRNFLEITFDNRVQLSIEAKNQNNAWQAITYPYQLFCGTGRYPHPLFPKEIVVTSVPILKGEFETSARFKIYNSVSEEFKISIDKSIFDSPFENKLTNL